MKTIEELQASMSEVVKFAEGEDRPLNDEEVTKWESFNKDLKAVQKTAEIKALNTAYEAPRVTVLSQMPKAIKSRDTQAFAADRYIRGDAAAGKELADMEGSQGAKVIPYSDLTGRASAMRAAYDRTGMQAFAQTETTTAGGYLVPTVTQDVLVKIQKAFGGISNQASHINTSHGAPINFPSIDDTGNTSVIAAINAAAGSAGADLAFTQISLGAFKYAATGTGQAGLKVPRELIDDALFDVTALVTEMLGVRLARKMAADYGQGVGTTAPNGLFHQLADGLGLTGGLVQATANAQLQTFIHLLDPAYVNENCVWIMNWAMHGILSGYVDSTNRPLMVPYASASIGSPPAYQLLGFPVVIDQGSPAFTATATTNPGAVNESFLAFGDISQAFLIRDVQGVGIAVDPYTGIGTNDVLYYGYARTDSVVQNRKAYVLLDGFHS